MLDTRQWDRDLTVLEDNYLEVAGVAGDHQTMITEEGVTRARPRASRT